MNWEDFIWKNKQKTRWFIKHHIRFCASTLKTFTKIAVYSKKELFSKILFCEFSVHSCFSHVRQPDCLILKPYLMSTWANAAYKMSTSYTQT